MKENENYSQNNIKKIDLPPEIYDLLKNERAKVFNSTLIEIFSDRASNIKPNNLLKNYQNKRKIYEPSEISPRIYNEISNIFFESVENDFECIELSPINPFGLNASLANVSQNNVLSSVRNSEVISDSSISMALECAYRIRKFQKHDVNLASSTRLIRMQNYGKEKKEHWKQHFRACSLVSSFRNTNNNMFLTLVLQIDNWLNTIENLKTNVGIESINVNLCFLPLVYEIYQTHSIPLREIINNSINPNFNAFSKYDINLPRYLEDINNIEFFNDERSYLLSIKNVFEFLRDIVIEPIRKNHPNINYKLQLNRNSGLNYYDGICYEIEVLFKNGKALVLVDGGITDWISKLLSDEKEKCISSGMGLEYLAKVYKREL